MDRRVFINTTGGGGATPAGSSGDIQTNDGAGGLSSITNSIASIGIAGGNNGDVAMIVSGAWAPTAVGIATRAVSGTTDTIDSGSGAGDCANQKKIQYTSASAKAVTMADADSANCTQKTIILQNAGSAGDITVTRASSDTFTGAGLAAATSALIKPGQTCRFTSYPANSWTVSCDVPVQFTTGTTNFLREDGTLAAASGTDTGFLGVAFCNGTVGTGNGSTYVLSPYNASGSNCNTGTSAVEIDVPVTCTAKNLRVRASNAGAVAGSGVVALFVGGSASALTCTLGTGLSCSDVTHTVALTAGTSVYSVRVTTGQATDSTAGLRVTFQCQ